MNDIVGARGKLSKKFEHSVNTSSLVTNGWLNIFLKVAYAYGGILEIVWF